MVPFRLDPQGPVQAYQTYQSDRPLATHWRRATCQEVDCDAYRAGWRTVVDVATQLGASQANYIRLHSGRHYTVSETGTLVTFLFQPGQTCFAPHKLPLGRPALYTVRGGDWRRDLGVLRTHTTVESFWDDLHESTERVARAIERG